MSRALKWRQFAA